MILNDNELLPSERAVYTLRTLYLSFGYRRYKVSKFEEYDLYAENKSFLSDKSILTFTDTDGRLMALKPDITLSIIKNTKDSSGMQKVFYNECVYRAGGSGFKEIMQTGLECIGDIDDFSTAEVISLAYKSLESISGSFLLDVSHMGFVTGLIGMITQNGAARSELMSAVGRKSADTVHAVCSDIGADKKYADALSAACLLYGTSREVLEKARPLCLNDEMRASYDALEKISGYMEKSGLAQNLRIDFSILNDTNYYNGIIFKGFIDGIPQSVLSGGRYDSLLSRLGRKQGAVGFAVYLDGLDRLFSDTDTCGGESIGG